jgi:hypothetical protein
VSLRLAGSASVAIAAVSIVLGTAACGADAGPAAERSDPDTVLHTVLDTVLDTGLDTGLETAPDTSTAATLVVELGVSEADVAELEQQLDEIDRVLSDLEAQLSED